MLLTYRAVEVLRGSVPFTEDEIQARVRSWDEMVRELATMNDETDTEEIWDEVLRNLGMDPATGGGLDL